MWRSRRLIILKGGFAPGDGGHALRVVDWEEAKSWLHPRSLAGHAIRYRDVSLRAYRLDKMTKPLATALLVRALARRRATLEDELGRVQVVSIRHLARLAGAAARDRWRVPSRLRRVEHDVGALELGNRSSQLELSRPPLYLRSDLWFGMPSGGSMGHISGVVNELSAAGTGPPIFVTTDTIGGVKPGVRTHVVPPGPRGSGIFRTYPRSSTTTA